MGLLDSVYVQWLSSVRFSTVHLNAAKIKMVIFIFLYHFILLAPLLK